MLFEKSVEIQAPIEAARPVLFDLEGWPELTDSITSVRLLDPKPLRVGSRVRIKQPRLPTAEWVVTELTDDGFVYEARGPGFHTIGRHWLTREGDNTRLRLELEQAGPLGPVMGRLTAGLTRKYLGMESAGMKRAAESAA